MIINISHSYIPLSFKEKKKSYFLFTYIFFIKNKLNQNIDFTSFIKIYDVFMFTLRRRLGLILDDIYGGHAIATSVKRGRQY